MLLLCRCANAQKDIRKKVFERETVLTLTCTSLAAGAASGEGGS
jgi:hypothetical protein